VPALTASPLYPLVRPPVSPVRALRLMPPPYREKGGCPSPCRHVITLLIKKPTPSRPWFRLRACQATTEPPAGAIDGNRGELRVWPAARQTELASTLPCLYSSSPTIPRPLHRAPPPVSQSRRPAGRRRPPRRPSPCPNQAKESTPKDPRVDPRPRPAGPGRRFAGIWPDRHRTVLGNRIAKFQIFLRA
jgi:hypothetical protein